MERIVPIVLVVDDDAKDRALATLMLKRCGYGVVATHDAADALDTCRAHIEDIALALIDAQLPRAGNVCLAESIHNLNPDVPVVLMTWKDGFDQATHAQHASVAVVHKPVRHEDLAPLLRTILETRRAASQRAAARPGGVILPVRAPAHAAPVRPPERAPVRPAVRAAAPRGGANTGSFHWPPSTEDLELLEVVDTATWRPLPINVGPINVGPINAGPINAGPIRVRPTEAAPIDQAPIDATPVVAPSAVARPVVADAIGLRAAPETKQAVVPVRLLDPRPHASLPVVLPRPDARLALRDDRPPRRRDRPIRVYRLYGAVAAAMAGIAFTTVLELQAPDEPRLLATAAPVNAPLFAIAPEPVLHARSLFITRPVKLPGRIASRTVPPMTSARPAPIVTRTQARLKMRPKPSERLTHLARDGRTMSPAAPTAADRSSRTPADRTSSVAPRSSTVAPPVTSATASRTDAASMHPTAAARRAESIVAPETDSIHATLNRYRTAYGRLDVAATRAVWPSVDTRALARAFGGLREQEVVFNRCALAVTGIVATATCGGRTTYVTRVGSQDRRSEPREWRFHLKKTGQDWMIIDASAVR